MVAAMTETKDLPKDPPKDLREPIMAALHTVYDPEVPVDIVQFGLVYGLDIDKEGNVALTMSLTPPSRRSARPRSRPCPA